MVTPYVSDIHVPIADAGVSRSQCLEP